MAVCVAYFSPLIACEEEVTCDKCVKDSEFSWNPDNAYLTSRLRRFYSLEEKVFATYSAHDYESAKRLASEYLQLADIYRCNWNYGNAIHETNRVFGLMSLDIGDIDAAAVFLEKAGMSPGSPQLDTFGPEFDLANKMLSAGKNEEVVNYLKGIRKFWEGNEGKIDKWVRKIEQGGKPYLKRFIFEFSPGQIAILVVLIVGLNLLAWQKSRRRKHQS